MCVCVCVCAQALELSPEDLRAAFDAVDADRSGRISADEMRRAIRRLGVPVRQSIYR